MFVDPTGLFIELPQGVRNFFRGVQHGTVEFYRGVYHAVTNPVETLRSIPQGIMENPASILDMTLTFSRPMHNITNMWIDMGVAWWNYGAYGVGFVYGNQAVGPASMAAGAYIVTKGAGTLLKPITVSAASPTNTIKNVTVRHGNQNVPAFRGGANFTIKPGEIRIDPTTGMVKSTHGVSLDVNPHAVQRFGGAHQIATMPSDLQIIQRGARLSHFEIVPRIPMSQEQFQNLLNQITTIPFP